MVMRVFHAVVAFFKNLGWIKSSAAALVVIAVIIAGNAIFGGSKAAEQPAISIRTVEVRSVDSLSSERAPLSIGGTVSSKSEATVRAESGGRVTAIYRNLGDSVSAGSIVAELEHASQSAALLQAQGSEAAAQAALNKIKKGTREEQLAILQSNLEAARSGAVNALLSAYAGADTAVRATTDAFYSNPSSATPRFNVTTSNANYRLSAENKRLALGPLLLQMEERSRSLTASDDLATELKNAVVDVRAVRDYIDVVIQALNAGVPTTDYPSATIATYQSSAGTARTTLTTALSSLASAEQTLETAQKNLDQGVVGSQPEDVAAAEATLMQARGAVAAARANLEKAIIRAPISGTVNSFSLKKGDYVSAGASVLTVANNGALEVLAYMTENDAKEIAVGQKASFDTGATGVITRIAPALDPVTKKIEVRIGITDANNSLTNGQSVLVQIERVNPKITTTSRVTIPISAIKVEADRVTVFTVNQDTSITAHEVTLGALLGDRVEVTQGLTGDMVIITDARGLREGQKVDLK